MQSKTSMSKLILAIASCMHCTSCPYPCGENEKSSMSNCSRQWYKTLMNMEKNEDSKEVLDEVFDLYRKGKH